MNLRDVSIDSDLSLAVEYLLATLSSSSSITTFSPVAQNCYIMQQSQMIPWHRGE